MSGFGTDMQCAETHVYSANITRTCHSFVQVNIQSAPRRDGASALRKLRASEVTRPF